MKRPTGRSGGRSGEGPGTGVLARLRAEGLHPRKALGQHFLHDRGILAEIVASAGVSQRDRVLEVGTGPGLLTRQLALEARDVLTVELDAEMLAFARRELRDLDNITFLQADILERMSRLRREVVEALEERQPFVWVSNLPYSVATTLIVLVCESGLQWTRAALTVQAEVAERLLATAGEPGYGPVSSLVAYWADARGGRRIVPGSFWPPPRVQSRVVLLERRQPLGSVEEYPGYRHWVKTLFSTRRKQVRRVLRDQVGAARCEEVLSRTGWDPACRPETLRPVDFLLLSRVCPVEGGSGGKS